MRPGLLANFKYYPLKPVTFSHMIEAKFITTNPRLNWSRLSLISAYLRHGLKSKNILGLHLRSQPMKNESQKNLMGAFGTPIFYYSVLTSVWCSL